MNCKRKLNGDSRMPKVNKRSKILYVRNEADNNCDKSLHFELNCDFLEEINRENFRNKLDECDSNCKAEESFKFCIKTKSGTECPRKKTEICLGTKNKQKKEPLPMKLRAFPQSFWQQPNKTPSVSPGTVYCEPPLLSKEENSPENRENLEETQPQKLQEVSEPNIDLLFSLFRNVEEEQRKALGQEKAIVIRRGRPKKLKTESKVIRDDDPYLTSSAAECFLPLLSVRNNSESLQSKIAKDEQILAMVSIDGSSSTLLTSAANCTNQNYSQILSELVVQL